VRILVLSRRKTIICFAIIILSLFAYVWNVRILPSLAGTYSMIHTNQKVVALTFDDGPDPEFTEAILEILKQKQVKATFFVIGENARQNPSLLRRMITEGHEIGNHGYTHDYSQRKLTDEIKQTDQSVYTATGTHTYFYRPPGGFVTKSQINMIKNQGYVVTLWSVDSRDWRKPGVNRIVSNVVQKVFPGAIVLLHDGGGFKSQTVLALEPLIDKLNADGYRFVTLSELQTLNDITSGT
jgi:peptidoglycan/xylan/chitin deacetylase (PgdA/CDA1 family)